jgi:hypothetical protein
MLIEFEIEEFNTFHALPFTCCLLFNIQRLRRGRLISEQTAAQNLVDGLQWRGKNRKQTFIGEVLSSRTLEALAHALEHLEELVPRLCSLHHGDRFEKDAALNHLGLEVVADADLERLPDFQRERDLGSILDLDERHVADSLFGTFCPMCVNY